MRKRFALAFVVIVLIVGLGAISLFYLNSRQGNGGEVDSITIGNAQSFECDTLVYVAVARGFFLQNGLSVNIKNYTSGAAAVNDLLNDEVDIAATAEFPLVRKAFETQNVSAIGSIGKFQLQDLIGRKDHGVESVSDLAGKRVGVALGTISEFYLGRFLILNEMGLQDVTLVNVDPLESVAAIVNGTVDALIIWQPYAYTAEEALGGNAVVFPVQRNQRLYILEVAKNEWIAQHSDIVKKFLVSLAQAEEYTVHNPSEVKALMQRNLNYSDDYMAAIWENNEFSLLLDQSLVLAMEDEARWMINNKLTNETVVPNFLNYIYVDGLGSVKPESVNVIR